jgi:hypothetical protein
MSFSSGPTALIARAMRVGLVGAEASSYLVEKSATEVCGHSFTNVRAACEMPCVPESRSVVGVLLRSTLRRNEKRTAVDGVGV